MWRVRPPHDGEEERPSRREYVIDEEKMCEIERLLCVFLFFFDKEKSKWELNQANKGRDKW